MPIAMNRPIRTLEPADLPRCLDLTDDRGWSREEPKWRLLFEVGEVFGVEDDDGGLAGVVVLTRYGRRLAAIGMMLVATRHGGQGLGRRLMAHALDAAGDATVTLYATPQGRPLYEKLGLRAIGCATALVGTLTHARPATRSRPATVTDLDPIAALDLPVFGADRGQLLRRMPSRATSVRVVDGNDGLRGYAAAWPTGAGTVVGPVVAPDVATAQDLIAEVAHDVEGPVRLELDQAQQKLANWLVAGGLARRPVPTSIMTTNGDPLPGDRRRLHAPLNVALG